MTRNTAKGNWQHGRGDRRARNFKLCGLAVQSWGLILHAIKTVIDMLSSVMRRDGEVEINMMLKSEVRTTVSLH